MLEARVARNGKGERLLILQPLLNWENNMATSHTASHSAKGKTRRTRRTGRRDPLAVQLLKTDHREVEGFFDDYEQLDEEGEKLALFKKIALALKVHTQIEEE